MVVMKGLAALFVVMVMTSPAAAYDGCQRYDPVPPHEPTGVKGCIVYGLGTASQWSGPGVARNDCVYPWTGCQPIRITSVKTGRQVVVTPVMYCDCYTTTTAERIVDLDPATLAALGLDPAPGLHDVLVAPVVVLPDTAVRNT